MGAPSTRCTCSMADTTSARSYLANAVLEVRPCRSEEEDRVRAEGNFLPLPCEFQRERHWSVLVEIPTATPGSRVHGWAAPLCHLDRASCSVRVLRQSVLEQHIPVVYLFRERVEWRGFLHRGFRPQVSVSSQTHCLESLL